MNRLRKLTCGGLVAALAVTIAGCTAVDPGHAEKTEALSYMSWWTSASEKKALEVIVADFKEHDPGVKLDDQSVAGGAGSNVQVELAKRLVKGDPPDVWQTFIGGYLQSSAKRGQLADATKAYEEATGYEDALPETIKEGLEYEGKPRGVATGTHRNNVLFYNVEALKKAGVATPTESYELNDFLSDLDKVKASGGTPLCLGGKDAFTSVELFENVLLATVGSSGWAKISEGTFDWGGTQARQALTAFGKIVGHADSAAGGQTWDAATADLGSGKCAFESMNDSAYGELTAKGAVPGTGFGVVSFPGTQESYLAVVDVFVVGAHSKNLANGMAFLATAGGKETQLEFNKIKGSVPIRKDVDVSSMSAYQQSAAAAYKDLKVQLSIAHGEAISPTAHGALYKAVAAYKQSKDAAAFAKVMEDALAVEPPRR